MSSRITAAATPIRLEIPGDDDRTLELQMSPLTDRDTDELDNWVQYKIVELARQSVANASPAEREQTIQVALQQAQTMSWTNGSGTAALATASGKARLLWQSVRKQHPAVTEEQLRPYFRYQPNIDRLLECWKQLNGLKEVSVANPPVPANAG